MPAAGGSHSVLGAGPFPADGLISILKILKPLADHGRAVGLASALLLYTALMWTTWSRDARVWLDSGMVNVVVDDEMLAAVGNAIRIVVAEEVTPRWRRLAAGDVTEKTGPHNLVTVADRRAEERLTEILPGLLPGSVVVGEEAVHADPDVLRRLAGDDPVWIVDPVDGTSNFVRGEPGFATLVALAQRGELLGSWTYVPVLELMATARPGQGAHLNGERIGTAPAEPGGALRVATSHSVYRTERDQLQLGRLEESGAVIEPCTCAGIAYLDIARGGLDGVLFFWESPWDHAAGLLLVAEAGGAHRTSAGGAFRVAGGNVLPFATACDEATVERVLGPTGER